MITCSDIKEAAGHSYINNTFWIIVDCVCVLGVGEWVNGWVFFCCKVDALAFPPVDRVPTCDGNYRTP